MKYAALLALIAANKDNGFDDCTQNSFCTDMKMKVTEQDADGNDVEKKFPNMLMDAAMSGLSLESKRTESQEISLRSGLHQEIRKVYD
eukprot:UN03869